jgi:EAL domain-containing protein (putative c-di-GMP-specific phosphodiesterase class I)
MFGVPAVVSVAPGGHPPRWSDRLSSRLVVAAFGHRTIGAIAVIVALLGGGFVLTFAFGGAHHVAPHWFYLPILIAGVRFGQAGAFPTAIAATVLAGPLTPGDVPSGSPQDVADWGVRGVFFVAIGAAVPALIQLSSTPVMRQRRDVRVEMEIRRALDRREFVLFYQPIIDLNDGRIVGAEALLRWQHPERGLLEPAAFIEDVERIGSIANWTLHEAAATTARWRTTYGLDAFSIAVNVSAQNLAQPDFVTQVRNAVNAAQLDPAHLCVELTESAMLDDIDTVAARLQVLRSIGVRIAIDDFGTGHATFSYLQQLPVDVIKIDRSFINDLGTRRRGDPIVSSLLQLGRRIGATCIAEGVETRSQHDILVQQGCTTAQGYLYARPLLEAHFEYLLNTHATLAPSTSDTPNTTGPATTTTSGATPASG